MLVSMLEPSRRSEGVRYAVRDILLVADEARRAGKNLIPLNIGDPLQYDFRTPPHLIEAVERAMRDGRNGYGDSIGLPAAIEAIRAEAARAGLRGVRDVFLCAGTSEGIEIAMAAIADVGDNVILPRPGYPLYEAVLAKLGIEARHFPLVEERGWAPDLAALEKHVDARTRAIVLLNPSNPTGAVFDPRPIVEIGMRRGVLVISDEIYDQLILDGTKHVPAASVSEDAAVLTFNGLSKAHLATGWRIGWGILSGSGTGRIGEAIAKFLRARLSIGHPTMYAVKPALEGDRSHVAKTVETLRRRRDLACEMLASMPGVSCAPPRAAFYAFPKITVRCADAEFAAGLVRETGVIVVHGSGFGGPGHIRLVFLPPEDTLRRALGLVRDHLAKLG